MAAYKLAAVKVTPPNDFPLGLIMSHMVVIHLFLMLCDLQRLVRNLCPTLYIVCTIRRIGAQEGRKKFQCKSKKQNWNDFDTDKVKSTDLQKGRHWTGILVNTSISEELILLVLPQGKRNVIHNNPLTCSSGSRNKRRKITSKVTVDEAPPHEEQHRVKLKKLVKERILW